MCALRTSGFQVQAQPGLQYLPASQLTPQLTNFLPAASQGAGFVSQLAGIADEAKAAPLRRQLQEIAVQRQQAELANLPMDRQLQELQLARASQPIERVLGTSLKRLPRINSPEDTPAQDEAGNYTFAEGDTNYDLTPVQTIESRNLIDGTTSTREQVLQPIATAETLTDRAENQELKRLREESLAGQRESSRQLAIERLNSPSWKRLGYGVNPSTGKQGYLVVNQKTGEVQEIPSDLVPVPTGQDAMLSKLDAVLGGASGAPRAAPLTVPGLSGAPVAAVVAPEDTPAQVGDAEAQALIDGLSQSFTPAVVAPPPKEKFSVGKTYTDAKGNKAVYLGNGRWQ